MTWYIYQGEDLKRDQKLKFPFYRSLEDGFSSDSLVFDDELIQCETLQPAKYPKEGLTRTNCQLTADLRNVDRSVFKKKMSLQNGTYYEVHYDLVVTIQAAVMKFSLEIDGKEMGSVEALYE